MRKKRLLTPAWAIFAIVVYSSVTTTVLKAETPDRPPNILWIVGENLDLDLGCYGRRTSARPTSTDWPTQGVRYTNVFSTSPVCAPSRSAFMTGMYQTSTDTHHMRSHRDDDFRLPAGRAAVDAPAAGRRLLHRQHQTHRRSRSRHGQTGSEFRQRRPHLPVGRLVRSSSTNQPFFAQINMPEAEYDIYDRKSAEKPRVKWVGEEWHPQIATPGQRHASAVLPRPRDRLVQEWARYLNSVSGMDVRSAGFSSNWKRNGWPTTRLSSSSPTTAGWKPAASTGAGTPVCTFP